MSLLEKTVLMILLNVSFLDQEKRKLSIHRFFLIFF